MKPLEHFLERGILEGRQAAPPVPAHVAVPRIVDCRRLGATVIIPVHGAREEARDCIASVLRNTEFGAGADLLVIDDASDDGVIRDMLAGIAGFPGLKLGRATV